VVVDLVLAEVEVEVEVEVINMKIVFF